MDKFFDDLFIRNEIGQSNYPQLLGSVISPSGSKITYSTCWLIFHKYDNIYRSRLDINEKVVLEKVFKLLDSSITFPNCNFKNFKRKATSNTKRNCHNIVTEFYMQQHNYIGTNCSTIGLSKSTFDNILSEKYDNPDVVELMRGGSVILSNKVIVELYKYTNNEGNNCTFNKKCKALCFLSGKENVSSKVLYNRLNKLEKKVSHLNKKTPSERSEIKSMLEKQFEFPKSAEDYSEQISIDKDELNKKVLEYKNNLSSMQLRWENLSKEKETLKEILFEERTFNEKNEVQCKELSQKLKDTETRLSDTCSKLQVVLTNGNMLCADEIKKIQLCRDQEIHKLQEDLDVSNDKYINLLQSSRDEIEKQVNESNKSIEHLKCKLVEQISKKRKSQKAKSYYRARVERLLGDKANFDYDSEIEQLRNEITVLENEKLHMQEELESFMINEVGPLKNIDGSYKNKVRSCFQDLIMSGVGIKQTKNIIMSVLEKNCNIHLEKSDLPSETFARSQYEEARLLAMAQLGTSLVKDYSTSHRTLQTDGTSKFGKHYGTYDISCKSGDKFVLGVRPMVTGDAETILSGLKEIINEIETVCDGSRTKMAQKILVSVKNTMSDRHIVQKKFNSLLQTYRSEIIPEVVDGWGQLSEEERGRMKSINFYFCGLHYVVGLATQAESALKVFDKLLHGETPVGSLAHGGYSKNSESGTIRLIRTLCKAVQERGCEKSGRMVDFDLSLEEDGIMKNRLAQFKGNRFNIIFYNAGIVYYLQENCKKFFADVFEENRLLSAVHYDLNVTSFIAGCRALGLVDKFLTGPLWRLLVKVNNILELNDYYQRIYELCSTISDDATDFLNGDIIFFNDFDDGLMNKDDIYDRLIEKNETFDELTKQILEILFGSFAIITKRMLHDHLKEGIYDNPSDSLIIESQSTPNENAFPESNFGCLDRLMREKPNANEITIESIIMFNSNKTKQWRDSLKNTEREKWMNWVKKIRKENYKQFVEKRKTIRKLRNEKRLTKILNKKRKEMQIRKTKEDLCKKIETYGGLWKSSNDINVNISKIKDAKDITDALKCQLKFRQKVLLEGEIVEPNLFHFSCKKDIFSTSKLKENLEYVIAGVEKVNLNFDKNNDCDNVKNVTVPIEKLNREKEKLKLLLLNQTTTTGVNLEPKQKKQKLNSIKKVTEQVTDKIPYVSNINEMTGKRVCHLSCSENGTAQWFNGTVICRKPESLSEMVIRYDGYPTLYSFDFSEFSEHLLKLIPLDPEFIVGKCIKHKFCDEKEVDEWYENGKVISYNPATALYTINYFDLEEDSNLPHDDYETELSVYETLEIDLQDDYLKHEIIFV